MWVLEASATLPLTETEHKLRAILEKVIYQDTEYKADGSGVQIKQGVAEDRLISTVDPDMRHGRKSKARTFNGYKTHIAIEKETEFITAMEVTPGNVHDSTVAKDLVDQQPETLKPSGIIGDHAYGTGEVRKDMDEQNSKVRLQMLFVAATVNYKCFVRMVAGAINAAAKELNASRS